MTKAIGREQFLGPRGPLVLPSVGPSVRPVHAKNLDHLYTTALQIAFTFTPVTGVIPSPPSPLSSLLLVVFDVVVIVANDHLEGPTTCK